MITPRQGLRAWFSRRLRPRPADAPLRADLMSFEQLSRHAQALASRHGLLAKRDSNHLLEQLDGNEHDLRAFNRATMGVDPSRRVTPAAEWLLDNFYLIEEQIQMAKRHLPHGYSRELPRLSEGPSAGLPRVYDLVLELIAHVDAQIDAAALATFVTAYQTKTTLKLGELWAIPIMLRLGLIENLKRITTRLTIARADRDLADLWVDRLQAVAEESPSRIVVVVADLAKSDLPVSSSFVAEFCQRLSRQNPILHMARSWLEQHLVEQGLSIAHLVQVESQNQAADQVSVSHSISSLRFLSAMEWKKFVESMSLVESILAREGAGVYSRMDFATRDRYRHAIESLSRHCAHAEDEVARQAVSLADASLAEHGVGDRSAHVGFYLIDRGAVSLEERLGVAWPWAVRLRRAVDRHPLGLYSGSVTLLSLLLVGAYGALLADRHASMPALIGLSLAFLLCASQFSVAVVNWASMLFIRPSLLPRIDCSMGLSGRERTVVVVPTLLTGEESIDSLLSTLELHHLSNRDTLLHFALLTDFKDAHTETEVTDAAFLGRAEAGVQRLNAKYPSQRGSVFYLFHRPRRWNAGEGLWMGYERKRGKLAEFNGYLRGASRSCFSLIVGATEPLGSVTYVITLDSDTQLPRDAARHLVGTMAHPLNRPVFDEKRGVVVEGYGILQPRIGVSLLGSRRSWFARLFASDAGIDPYTREVSDVYQDLFHEGSFIGKGIYDVDAFERAMKGKFPENKVLSHDLLESCHARSALVSDVQFYEEYPSRYNVDVDRRHRWIRGDWQITQWLLPRVPGPDARRIVNPLSALSLWKLADNLRRSVVPLGLLVLVVGTWFVAAEPNGVGTAWVLGLVAAPGLIAGLVSLLRKPRDQLWLMHGRDSAETILRQLAQVTLTIVLLPYDVFVSLDAIGRSLLRQWVTHTRLLQWRTSSDSERQAGTSLVGFYLTMWISPVASAGVGLALLLSIPSRLSEASPMLVAWFFGPCVAWWLSRTIPLKDAGLDAGQLLFLRTVARKTWHYFTSFVTAQEHWLPPDNFQETPRPLVAHRTSPTNMGLSLLANLTAKDLGYLSVASLIERTRDSLATMDRLERYRGHFYNWYDTRTLQPLLPLYISSVDSGNLAGHLLTLASGLREIIDEPFTSLQAFDGLVDTIAVLVELVPENRDLVRFEQLLSKPPLTAREACALLEDLERGAQSFCKAVDGGNEAIVGWATALQSQCVGALAELRWSAPWLTLPAAGGAASGDGSFGTEPSFKTIAGWVAGPIVDGSSLADQQARALAASRAQERMVTLEVLATQCEAYAAMDFAFLFNADRDLFCTGFNVSDRRFETGFYDLLASEARLCSYVAIALGQVPQDHWFSLGRLFVAVHGKAILVSWSGSMFEYLMPLLVMPNYVNTLLDNTCRAAVGQQIDYGALRGVPWGISESGYNRTDLESNYQYKAFGVPGLGFKRGLSEDLVVAPYASALALMVSPAEACKNLERLSVDGRMGGYGFYESVDYTAARLPPSTTSVTLRSFMVHHQGMSLVSIGNLVGDSPMQRRFMACPLLKAADLLLQERMPKTAAGVLSEDLQLEESQFAARAGDCAMRIFPTVGLPAPEVALLSNGRYHVAITSAGGGYSRWNNIAVTRWREDPTRDCWGTFVYLRDMATGEAWSAAHQPMLRSAKADEAIFTEAKAEFRQRRVGVEIHTEIGVSPEDDVEVRRITLVNTAAVPREIELTTYAEVVLASQDADLAHPAFSNLFVETEFMPEESAVLCTRRPRADDETSLCLFHLLVSPSESGVVSCETDRSKFIGRGGSLENPAALASRSSLSNTCGPVLDPIVSLREVLSLPPYGTVIVDLILGVAETRSAAVAQIEKYQGTRMADRAFDLGWTHSQVTLQHLNSTGSEAQLFCRLASALIYADPARRPAASILRSNHRGQSALWSHGISGDLPVVLLQIDDPEKIEIVHQLIRAHAYWRLKGLAVELVVLTEDVAVYRRSLQEEIIGFISSGIEAQMLQKPGGIFVHRLDQIAQEDRILMQSVARIFIDAEKGSLLQQLEYRSVLEPVVPAFVPTRSVATAVARPLVRRELVFDNGLGGFTPDGHEYVITLGPGQTTPAPWVNILANPSFGTLVSESGGSYSWVENSHEFRLTPWANDPVRDPSGECLYLRDEQSGAYWSPTPLPARGKTPYVIRHGFGYTVFEHTEHGIASELWVYVAIDAPVKFSVLKLRNLSGRARRVSVTGYWEWVLGDTRHKCALHIQTEVDLKSGALIAQNPYNTEWPGRVVFVDTDDLSRSMTGDRKEFIGRNGTLGAPAALRRARLSGKVGAGFDPCGALQVSVDLAENEEKETTFRLGVGRNPADVQTLIQRFRRAGAARSALEAVWAHWNATLGAVKVETPDPAVNILANGWLIYQTIASRVWGRTGFYQSGGAYGFRDQLQDTMALVHADPGLSREQILRAASRQFREGDVQHWWHPPGGRGVRTHCSDDFLWLPYATCRYLSSIGDTGILDERLPGLEGRLVKPEEESYYDMPNPSETSPSVYEHCVKAIEHGLIFGAHGLPLIGSGDWNDGMNRVGYKGKGESVWLAFFLYDVLKQFAQVAASRGDSVFATRCLTEAATLQRNIEAGAWDGSWYRRAYFDDGSPLGSHTNVACQIDSLPQSWAVLSGAAESARARRGMLSVDSRLVRRDSRIIQLFDPPFDGGPVDPGYIKGYIPGVRENGGQYTHAAIWVAMAFAHLGENKRAWEIFSLLNPIHHGGTPRQIETYKVEPYVVAADLYSCPPLTGRGGWTWYTGSAGWMYRLLVETLLGVQRSGSSLVLSPRIPEAWSGYKIHYRYKLAVYHISIERADPASRASPGLTLDGADLPGASVPLSEAAGDHSVRLVVG